MSNHFFHSTLLMLLFVYADLTSDNKVHYYITPSQNMSCPEDSCLTLSQFAANSSRYLDNKTDISLFFLPGNYSLNIELSLAYAHISVTKYGQGSGTVFIECVSQSGRFNISETTFVSIKGLHFIGCGGNTVTQVDQFILEDIIFQKVENKGTVLILTVVAAASIVNSLFLSNSVSTSQSSIDITNSSFTYNSETYGGVMYTSESSFSITNCIFINNSATYGGVLYTTKSSFNVISSTFADNSASDGGVIPSLTNKSVAVGGVLYTSESSFSITNSTFTNNRASVGGVMATFESWFNIINSNFSNNNVLDDRVFPSLTSNSVAIGGVMFISESSLSITNSIFSNNRGGLGGVMHTSNSSCKITNSILANSAAHNGGVVHAAESSFSITNSIFGGNFAISGGVMATLSLSLNITITISNSIFSQNAADVGGIMFAIGCSIHIADSKFDHNSGSLYTFNGNITFSGYTRFENCMELYNKVSTAITHEEGGAITSYQSSVIFTGVSSLLNNQARDGGAILAIESTITMYGETTIASNVAIISSWDRLYFHSESSSGGGIYLYQSDVEIKGNCIITQNHAMRGGGIYASRSSITVYQQGAFQFINNSAETGGGTHLEVDSRLTTLTILSTNVDRLVTFAGNHAKYGGALYVSDDTSSAACTATTDCFIQALALTQFFNVGVNQTVHIFFFGNSATERGSNLFGGLLNRCIPSPFAEVYAKQLAEYGIAQYNGVSYLGNISNIELDSIASRPVWVCFCNHKGQSDCSYQPPSIQVKKGETFIVSLVAVDQVNHPVDANITSLLSSSSGGFGEGQQTQKVNRNCTDLTFNVFSLDDSETITLFADGPCGSSEPSIQHVNIQFKNCTCPVGFEPSNSIPTTCTCDCDSVLSPYITKCNYITNSLLRVDTNSWITYVNNTDSHGYVIYPNCPFDYCYPPTEALNFSLPYGADAQCAYNRTGVLCGTCQQNFSLSLGSSHCLPCHSYWPAVLVAILLAAATAGILLVIVLLILNMTVTVGLINGVILYANIVAASSGVVFPSTVPSFPTVFVAWLNLDIGFDVCFFDGLETYTKTWLQLGFPAYIISLVVIVIIVSERSPRFTRLIGPGRRDPVATLATLTLLSYTKLLSTTIAVFSFAILYNPDGSRVVVWLPDGNLRYFQGKHIALVVAAFLIILIGVPYTLLLLFWQWLIRTPNGIFFRWTKNTKLNAIITTYHAPYNYKHRYWTGLLLLVRVVLYITAAVTESGNPQVPLLMTIILVGGLFFLKGIIGMRLYRRSSVDIVETVILLNLLSFAAFSLYKFKADNTKQAAITYISTITTFLILVGGVVYHMILFIKRKRTPEDQNEYPLILPVIDPSPSEVTHSIVEIPKPSSELSSNDSEKVSGNKDCQNEFESAPCEYNDHVMDSEDDSDLDTLPLLAKYHETM